MPTTRDVPTHRSHARDGGMRLAAFAGTMIAAHGRRAA
jgi:hypothetical protein